MGQIFSKCLGSPKKRGKQPVAIAATSSGTATLPNQQTQSPSGVTVHPNQPTAPPLGVTVLPNEPIPPPSGGTNPPEEPIHVRSEATALPNEATVPSSQPTAPAPETSASSPKERDFWKEAVEALPEEYKLPEEWRTVKIDREEVVGMVNAKTEECEEKQWKFKINGKEITVREIFGKTLEWVQKFAVVGDTAVQYDPGTASLPWAGFRFLLQVAVNEMEAYGAMLVGLERATWLASYCWAQERLYKEYFAGNDKYSDLNSAFVNDLVHMYTAIMKFLIQVHKFYTKGTAARIGNAIIRPSSWVGELTRAIDDRKRRMEDYASLVHKSNVHQDLKNMLGMLEPFSKYMSEEVTRREEKERGKFMKWLSDIDYKGDHEANSRNILKDSGDWMLSREDTFQSWKEKGGLLWLCGIAGAGKTKLTSTIIDHLMRTDENHTVAYFYCIRDTKQPKKEDPEEILRAILKQLVILLPRQLSDGVKKKYEEERKKGGEHGSIRSLTFEECAHFIAELASSRPVTIIIDALDECRENKPQSSQGSPTDRQDLLERLKKMIVAKPGNVKVFLSSRGDDDIRDRLRNYPTITIEASKNGHDILRFIKSEVEDLITKRSFLRDDETLKQEIIKAVNDRAHGMFQFAALQINYLGEQNTRDVVKESLKDLPTTLIDLYNVIYARIKAMKDKESSIATRTLSWLLCAQRRLLSSELLAAVSSDTGHRMKVEELLRLCRHLVVLNEVSDSFELAHLSVREYLETRDEYKDGQPHTVVAERCIKLFEPDVPRGILDEYASIYWMDHYNSRPQTGEDAVTNVAKKFFRDEGVNPAFKAWAKIAGNSIKKLPWYDNVTKRLQDAEYKPLSVVCVFGFPKLLDLWKDTQPGYSYFRDSDDMVVHLAIKWGNGEVAFSLLRRDAQLAIDIYGMTSLFWAALYQSLPVLEVLKTLQGGVDAEDKFLLTALDWMVLLGQIEGLKLLLKVGAGTNKKNEAKWTPLHWAAFLDRGAEVRELAKDHRMDAKDCDGLTAFQWATFLGYEATAKDLGTGDTGSDFGSSLRISPTVKEKLFFFFRAEDNFEDDFEDRAAFAENARDLIKIRDEAQIEIRQAIAEESASSETMPQDK